MSHDDKQWQHFDAAYKQACESSQPKDWMKAALFAQQVRTSAPSSIAPIAEVVEIDDTMDSYTQRPPKQRSIVPYKPIDQLPVGTKLYAAPSATARKLALFCWQCGAAAKTITTPDGRNEIEKLVDEILTSNPKQVEDYRSGNEKAFNSLVGQVMKATGGKANPAHVNEILRERLKP